MNAGAALITGGAGFIGTNLADRLLSSGKTVLILDDLSRPGVRENLAWLTARHSHRLRTEIADIADVDAVGSAVADASEIYHLASQVAVTTSLETPLHDFEVNLRGTLTLLECMRRLPEPPPLIFTSTNKVYGGLEDVKLRVHAQRYVPCDESIRRGGISESRPLDFHSPYGCSKGAADQYVLDYARSFGLTTIVFRMSCIYGPHQHGNEDQGWVAHFLLRARRGERLTVFGDGLQVRDLLYVDDLVDAFEVAMRNAGALAGRPFNIGGGVHNTLSLLELIQHLRETHSRMPRVKISEARRGDQRYYVSDTSAFGQATGWRPQVTVPEGLARLTAWIDERVSNRTPEPTASLLQAASGR